MPSTGRSAAVKPGNAFSWRFATPLFMVSALNPINSSILATALVPIAAAVHVPVGRTAVLVSVLYLASAITEPTGGKLWGGVRAAPGVHRGHVTRRPSARPGNSRTQT